MATVYRCRSALSDRLQGALKVVDLRTDPGARDRFVREIDTLLALRHPAIIRVLSAGEDAARHLLYMVMELIEGEDLAHRLGREPVGWRDAARVFVDVAEGLHHAHEVGVHHRDLKPANVMITPSGGGVLVDFGIALDQDRTRLTEVGMVPGTVAYMPPELLLSDSRSIDPALADVYAFGLVVYETLSRQRAFPGFQQASRNDLVRLVQEKLDHPPFDPGEGVPQALRGLIRSCTQPNPMKRPRMHAAVRVLRLVLEPPPGAVAASAVGEDDLGEEPTMVMSAPVFDAPGPADPGASAGPPRTWAGEVPPRPAPAPHRAPDATVPFDRPLAPAPFEEDLADTQNPVSRSALKTALARQRRRSREGSGVVVWGTALGLVVGLAGATSAVLALVWYLLR